MTTTIRKRVSQLNSAVKKLADEKLKEAYGLCYLPLIKYCNVRMGDARASADDCVQEAFLVYYNRLLSGEQIENPRAYLYRTADNFVKRAVESYSKTVKHTVPLEQASELQSDVLSFIAENTDYDSLAEKLLDSLSDREKQFYRLKYTEKLSLSEIAKLLDISPSAAASSRLRLQIKEKITHFIESQSEGDV